MSFVRLQTLEATTWLCRPKQRKSGRHGKRHLPVRCRGILARQKEGRQSRNCLANCPIFRRVSVHHISKHYEGGFRGCPVRLAVFRQPVTRQGYRVSGSSSAFCTAIPPKHRTKPRT